MEIQEASIIKQRSSTNLLKKKTTNEKKHKMKSREISKFKVNFANTDRLKNSSIITMQNMLNEDDRRNTS